MSLIYWLNNKSAQYITLRYKAVVELFKKKCLESCYYQWHFKQFINIQLLFC